MLSDQDQNQSFRYCRVDVVKLGDLGSIRIVIFIHVFGDVVVMIQDIGGEVPSIVESEDRLPYLVVDRCEVHVEVLDVHHNVDECRVYICANDDS